MHHHRHTCGPFRHDAWAHIHHHMGHRHRSGGGPRHRGGPPGPPPWFFKMFGDPPPRAGRGDVRYLILDALEAQPRHGYEVIQVIEERSNGAYRPSPGTVYPTLQLLDEMGLVSSQEEGGRRIYSLTEAGRAELDAHRGEVEDAYDRLGGPDYDAAEQLHEMARRLHRVVRTIARAMRRGGLGPRRVGEIERIIREAAERIEEVLKD